MQTNPERQPKWPRLPWARWPEWRPTWRTPEAETLAERVEASWRCEPLPDRIARRLLRIARRLEGLRDGPDPALRAWFASEPPAAIERAKRERAEECARNRARWCEDLAAVERALAEVERDLEAAATAALVEGGDNATGS